MNGNEKRKLIDSAVQNEASFRSFLVERTIDHGERLAAIDERTKGLTRENKEQFERIRTNEVSIGKLQERRVRVPMIVAGIVAGVIAGIGEFLRRTFGGD